jgi:hypothetical protein
MVAHAPTLVSHDKRTSVAAGRQGTAILDLLIRDPDIMAETERLLSGKTRDIWLRAGSHRLFECAPGVRQPRQSNLG